MPTLIEKLKSSWDEENSRYETYYRMDSDIVKIYTHYGYSVKYLRAVIFSPALSKWEFLAQHRTALPYKFDKKAMEKLESELLDEAQMILSITKEGLNHADA